MLLPWLQQDTLIHITCYQQTLQHSSWRQTMLTSNREQPRDQQQTLNMLPTRSTDETLYCSCGSTSAATSPLPCFFTSHPSFFTSILPPLPLQMTQQTNSPDWTIKAGSPAIRACSCKATTNSTAAQLTGAAAHHTTAALKLFASS